MLGQTLSATLDIKSTAIEESLGTRGALEQGRNIQSKKSNTDEFTSRNICMHYLRLNKLLVLHHEYNVNCLVVKHCHDK